MTSQETFVTWFFLGVDTSEFVTVTLAIRLAFIKKGNEVHLDDLILVTLNWLMVLIRAPKRELSLDYLHDFG